VLDAKPGNRKGISKHWRIISNVAAALAVLEFQKNVNALAGACTEDNYNRPNLS
jgi:hypothetical protein